MNQRHRKSRDDHLNKHRAICDSLKVLEDDALLEKIRSANAEELPALSTLWLYYAKKNEGRKRVADALLDRLLVRGLELGYFNLIRGLAYEHVEGGSVNYDMTHLIAETISEIGWAIAKRPSTQRVTSWETFCRSKFLDGIKKLDRHEALGNTNGRVDAIGPSGRDRMEEALASANPGTDGTFAARIQAFEFENLLDFLRGVIRRTKNLLMIAVFEELISDIFDAPDEDVDSSDGEDRRSLEEDLGVDLPGQEKCFQTTESCSS